MGAPAIEFLESDKDLLVRALSLLSKCERDLTEEEMARCKALVADLEPDETTRRWREKFLRAQFGEWFESHVEGKANEGAMFEVFKAGFEACEQFKS